MTDAGRASGDDPIREPRSAVAKNTAVLVSLRVGAPALSVLLMLVLSRKLGAEGVGRYALAYGFLYLGNALAPLGLPTILTREGARDRSQLMAVLAHANTLGTLGALILTAVMMGIGLGAGYDEETGRALVVLSAAILPGTLRAFLDATIVAIERTELIAVATGVDHVFKVGAGIALLSFGHGLDAVLAAAVVGQVLACFVSSALLGRAGVRVRWAFDREILTRLGRLAPTFLLISLFATLYWRIDVFMLSRLVSIDEVGYYGAAWRLLSVAMVLPQGLCLSLYPRLAVAGRSAETGPAGLHRSALRLLFALTLPTALGVSLVAPSLLAWVYGEEFREAAATLAFLIWTLVPYGVVRYVAYALVAMERQRVDLQMNIAMSLVNVALNAVLIPRYGIAGAALATLASITVFAALQMFYLRRALPGWGVTKTVPISVLCASAVMGLAIGAASPLGPVAAVAIAPLVYGLALGAFGFFRNEDLSLFGFGRRSESDVAPASPGNE